MVGKDQGSAKWGVITNGYGISFGGDKDVLEVNSGDCYTTLC